MPAAAARAAVELVGRHAERDALVRLLEGTREGGTALVLRGGAGVGRSALLADAGRAAAAAGMRVLLARGVAGEARLPLAALHQLLAPLLGSTDRLPAPQREVLRSAFAGGDGTAPSPLRIGTAALDLLVSAAAARPVLAVADDLHRFDRESAQVMLFLARRLSAAPVVLLAGGLDGWPDGLGGADVDELRLEGLAAPDAERLLHLTAPHLDGPARRRVLRWATGNPLALIELPRTVHLAESVPGRHLTPLTERLERAFAGRLHDLPGPTRTLLLAAAMHPAGRLGEVAAAAAVVDPAVTLDALPPAVDAALVTVAGTTVRFRHPLVRAAVYQAAPAHERMAMHGALAARPARSPEQAVWHRVAASAGPDAELAGELQSLAARYVRRGELEAAVTALEQSADLTAEERRRGRRLLDAASTALHLGRTAQVDQLLRQTDDLLLAPAEVRRRRLLRWATQPPAPGDPAGLQQVVLAARRSAADGDWDTAVALLLVAARAEAFGGRGESSGTRILEALDDIGDRADDPRCLLVRAIASPLRSSADVIRTAVCAPSRELDADGTAMVATAAMWVHAPDAARPLLDAAEEGLRRGGDLMQLSHVLVMRAWAGFFLGDWDQGLVDAVEGAQLSRETEQLTGAATLDVLGAAVAALRGDRDGFERTVTGAEQVGVRAGAAVVLNLVLLARALVCMADGAHATAYQHLLRAYDREDPAYHRTYGYAWLTYLAEAALHCGQAASARAVLDAVEPELGQSDAAQLDHALRYARAVLADDDEAEPLFEKALSADLGSWPLDSARLQLAWGMWLRRRRRPAESRAPLRRARDAFDAVGALAWAAQARRELRAAGERSLEEDRHDGSLTAQELQIARLAALGLTNREIGQRIFASHRTVASHMYRIFPKLGITSRRQLHQVLSEPDPPAEAAGTGG